MIVFDLECRGGGHAFEGWFGSSQDFADQQARGLVACPQCGSVHVVKAVMAPHLGRKGNQTVTAAPPEACAPSPASRTPVPSPPPALSAGAPMPPQARAMIAALAQMQAAALKSSRWVGRSFADDARAMHYGESAIELIHGQASPDEARALVEEGIEIAPILFPLAAPDELN